MTTFTATNVSGPTGVTQTFTVPDTGPYFIRAFGAQGGGPNGGLGAMESGVFNLTAGEVIRVRVGQRPLGDTGGGGGTFIVKAAGDVPLLIAAGGGGSSPGHPRAAFMDGQAAVPPLSDANGQRGENNGSTGGTGGDGGRSVGVADLTGSGGGFLTSGDSATNGAGAPIALTEGRGYLQGGTGGNPISGQMSSGGFGGGGGGGSHGGGGGGGFNGGGGARVINAGIRAAGGGGGSYNIGMSQEGQSGVRTGEGEAMIVLVAQPQPPANVTATPDGTDVEVCWQSPGEEDVWAEPENVYVEIRRRDCEGQQHIATVSTGGAFSGCYVDRFAPLSGTRETCADPVHECEVTYQVRYVGLVSGVANPPSLVPEGFIVGYDGPLAEIPSGWTRVAALNGRYPKGATGATSGATGGASTHTHTSPGHTHEFDSHRHTLPANLGGSSSAGVDTKRWERNVGGVTERFSSRRGIVSGHSHSLGGWTSYSPVNVLSGAPVRGNTLPSAPSTSSGSNEPPHRTAVFIVSNGTPTSLPPDSFVLGTSTPAGFSVLAAQNGRYLKGAAAGSTGGGTGGTTSHTHTLNAHTHGTGTHDHPGTRNSSGQSPYTTGPSGLSSDAHAWVSLDTAAGGTRLVREAASPDNTRPPTNPSTASLTHRHDVVVNPAGYGTTSSNGSGTSDAAPNRPSSRALRALRPVTGQIRTGLIGMWLGNVSTLPTGLTRCNGANGTPDMRGRLVEGAATGTGQAFGTNSHTHTVPAHTHTLPTHAHTLTILPFSGLTMRAVSGSPTNARNPVNHSHSLDNTGAARPAMHAAPAQALDSVTVEPPFSEVHFVRIDAVGTSDLNEEVVQSTEDGEASTTVTAPDGDMALLKHPVLDVELLGCPDVNWTRLRPFESTQALQGGMPTVIVGDPGGRDFGLTFTVDAAGKDALEQILAATVFWMQPARGPAGWFTAGPWTVTEMKSSPTFWQVDVTLTETDPQAVPLAEDLL